MPHYGYWNGPDGGLWMMFHAAFWLLLVAALVGMFLVPPRRARQSAPTAADLLDQRYAKGEIDRDEYLQRKKDLAERPEQSAGPKD